MVRVDQTVDILHDIHLLTRAFHVEHVPSEKCHHREPKLLAESVQQTKEDFHQGNDTTTGV
jgi:hypothetical protein